MKLAVIGSRNCPEIDLEDYIKTLPDAIVSGGAKGVDTYAREYALKHNIELIEFLPEYKKYGRRAPLVRNKQIVDACDKYWQYGMVKAVEPLIPFNMPRR